MILGPPGDAAPAAPAARRGALALPRQAPHDTVVLAACSVPARASRLWRRTVATSRSPPSRVNPGAAHLLVTDSLSRQALYVGMTRGRESNTAHVVTGKTAPSGREPYQQAAPEAVLAEVMHREADDLSATEQIRQAQEWAGGTGHLQPVVRRHQAGPLPHRRADQDQAHRLRSLALPARALPPGLCSSGCCPTLKMPM